MKRLLTTCSGVTAIEYAMIASLITVICLGVIGAVGTSLSGTFATIAGKL